MLTSICIRESPCQCQDNELLYGASLYSFIHYYAQYLMRTCGIEIMTTDLYS